MLKYVLGLAAISSMYFDNAYYATEILAVMLVGFSLFFYKLVFVLVSGQAMSDLNFEETWQDMWTQRLLHILGVIALFKAGNEYLYVVAFIAPWMILNIATDILNSLIRMDILEFKEKE